MKIHRNINLDRKPKKCTWRLNRPPIPGMEKRVDEVWAGGHISYEGLNAELRKLGYKTMSWSPK